MCEPDPPNSTRMEGDLLKRPRGRHSSVRPKARFKQRFFRLTDNKLEYYKNKSNKPKGFFEVVDVKVIERVDEKEFGHSNCFEIGNEKEYMYMVAPSQEMMHQWMKALQQAVQQKGVHMLPFYHPGFYNQKAWTCCKKENRTAEGCISTGSLPTGYEEGGVSYHKERFSDTSSRIVTENSELVPLKPQDPCLRLTRNDSTHRNQLPKSKPLPRGTNDKRDSGFVSGGSDIVLSRPDSSYGALEKPQTTLGTKTNVGGKQRSAHPLSQHHQKLRECKSVPLVAERTSNETNGTCEETSMENHDDKSNASMCKKLAEQPITAIAFLSSHMIVYATGDHHVCIYNVSESELLYDVKLTYPVTTLDVWDEKYILVGSFPVQLFEMKTDRLRRIIVMDLENNHQLTASSSSLGAFLPNGCFATANEMGKEVTLWPSLTEENGIITKAATRLAINKRPEQARISSMWGTGSSEHPFLAIERKDSGQTIAVDVFDCSDFTCIKEIERPVFENVYLLLEKSGRMNIERKYGSLVTTVGRSQSLKAHIPVALDNGTIVLYEDVTAFSTLNSDGHSRISSLVYRDYDGTAMVAAGYKSGKLGLWEGKFETKIEPDFMKEIFTAQVFLDDSFYRESLLCDYYEFTVNFNGGKFENYPSYSLEIPRGAIPEGEEIVIRTGIIKYGPCGPFKCQESINIVSPVVWLCSNRPNFQFLSPAILELQHCCNMPESLELLKADHGNMNGTHTTFEFQKQTSSQKPTSGKCYHSTEITHFCLYCLGIYSSDDGKQQGFRLTPVERKGYMDKTHQVIFCLSYNLGTCHKAVREQYPSDEFRIGQALPVQFQSGAEIDTECSQSSSGWTIAKKCPGHSITLEDLKWEQELPTQQALYSALFSAHRRKEYPPRFILEFCGKDAERSDTITVSLTNVTRPVSYDIALHMPSTEEEGQVETIVHSNSGFSDDSGFCDERNTLRPTFQPFPANAST